MNTEGYKHTISIKYPLIGMEYGAIYCTPLIKGSGNYSGVERFEVNDLQKVDSKGV